MKNLLPVLIFVLFVSACKEDNKAVSEGQTPSTTTVKESPAKPVNSQEKPQAQEKAVAETKTASDQTESIASDKKTNTTVKVNTPSSATGKLKISQPVVRADVHNNSMSVTMHKAPEKVMDSYPFNVDLKTVDGSIVNSSNVLKKNGKPTVILFWLTTCKPCHMKMDAIKPLYPEWKDAADFNVVAISGDLPQNYPSFVKQVKRKGWDWDTYNDVNRGFRDILPGGLNGYPQTFIFDKNGNLIYQDKKFKSGDELALFEQIKKASAS